MQELVKHVMVDFVQMSEFSQQPFIIERGDGIRLYDVDGKAYIDGLSGVFVVGTRHTDPRALDLAAASMRMWKNGEPCGSGSGAAVQGHPAEAVAWLANTLGAFGIPFRAGELILSGSLAALVPAAAGDRFTMEIEGLGGCSIAFSE